MKKHFFIAIVGLLIGVLVGYYILISEYQENETFSSTNVLIISCFGIVLANIIYFISSKLDKMLPWQKHVNNRLLIGIVANFAIAYALVYGLLFSLNFFSQNTILTSSILIKIAIVLFVLVLLYEIIYFALYSYYSYATLQIETVRQERKQIELQLKALKSQLSPHFLFNGLNTVSSLVFKDENKAEKFIRKLANMYNYTLKSYDVKLITVEEELEFVKSYIYLIQTRFNKSFTCTIQLDDTILKTKIPPLTLQMLVENAVKHNILTIKNPVNVTITSAENQLIVQNNITEKPTKITSFNIGLKNINARYLLLAQQGISSTNGENFTVKLPLI